MSYREGGGVGDPSIRKTAYFEGAMDPTLYGKVYILEMVG